MREIQEPMTTPLHPALAGLHDVDWTPFGHPGGTEEDPTELMVRLVDADPAVARRTAIHLDDLLNDAMTYEPVQPHHPNAARFLPFLLGLLREPDPPAAPEIAEVLYNLSLSQICHPTAELRRALLSRIDDVVDLLWARPAETMEWLVGMVGNLGTMMWGITARDDLWTEAYGTFTVPEVDVVPPGLIDPVGRTPESPWPRVPADIRAIGDAPVRLATALRAVLADADADPRLRRDALLAAVLVDPEDPSWVTSHLSEEEPWDVRVGALWVSAWKGLPWNETATATVLEGWGERAGYLSSEWFWEGREPSLEALVMRDDPELHVVLLTELMARGEDVLSAARLLYDRYPRSRPGVSALSPAVREPAREQTGRPVEVTEERTRLIRHSEKTKDTRSLEEIRRAAEFAKYPSAFRGFRHNHVHGNIGHFESLRLAEYTGETGPLMRAVRNLWERQGPGPWLLHASQVLKGTEHVEEFLSLVRAVRRATPISPLQGHMNTLAPARDTCDLLDRVIADLEGPRER